MLTFRLFSIGYEHTVRYSKFYVPILPFLYFSCRYRAYVQTMSKILSPPPPQCLVAMKLEYRSKTGVEFLDYQTCPYIE